MISSTLLPPDIIHSIERGEPPDPKPMKSSNLEIKTQTITNSALPRRPVTPPIAQIRTDRKREEKNKKREEREREEREGKRREEKGRKGKREKRERRERERRERKKREKGEREEREKKKKEKKNLLRARCMEHSAKVFERERKKREKEERSEKRNCVCRERGNARQLEFQELHQIQISEQIVKARIQYTWFSFLKSVLLPGRHVTYLSKHSQGPADFRRTLNDHLGLAGK